MKIIKKPWGKEFLIEINSKYLFKKLYLKKNCRCSLQYHDFKLETIYILDGKLKIFFGEEAEKLTSEIFEKGESITIKPKIIHRMEAIEDCVYLESSTPEINDVTRLSDDYVR